MIEIKFVNLEDPDEDRRVKRRECNNNIQKVCRMKRGREIDKVRERQ